MKWILFREIRKKINKEHFIMKKENKAVSIVTSVTQKTFDKVIKEISKKGSFEIFIVGTFALHSMETFVSLWNGQYYNGNTKCDFSIGIDTFYKKVKIKDIEYAGLKLTLSASDTRTGLKIGQIPPRSDDYCDYVG